MEHTNKIHTFSCLDDTPFCIYGAGIVAASIYTAIKTLYNKKPLFFLVSDAAEGKCDENPTEIDGIVVKRLSEWKQELQELRKQDVSLNASQRAPSSISKRVYQSATFPDKYLVVTPETHHASIAASLHSLDIEDSQIILFTNELENAVMEAYYSSVQGSLQVGLQSGTVVSMLARKKSHNENECDKNSSCHSNDDRIGHSDEIDIEKSRNNARAHEVQVFQAKCHVDRPLQKPIENPSYVHPIQVGADLTDKVISKLRDNTGDHISYKNRNYCELTATYYAWKNSHADYKGLCHYRRVFDISDAQMQELLENKADWDVILPYPSIHYPNISTQHIRYINDSDWNALLTALRESAPDYFEAYNDLVLSGEKYFYNFNMLIARAKVFDDYCSFLFKVLEKAEELTTPKGAERADRFAGYMGEDLTTLYFLKNRDKLKILYAGKIWLI